MSKEADKGNMTELEFSSAMGLVYQETFSGDQSFADLTLYHLGKKLESFGPVDELDVMALWLIIQRIANSKESKTVICGKPEGRPKKGFESLTVAMTVYKKVRYENLSVKAAQLETAEKKRIPPGRVKRYWLEWKDRLDETVTRYEEVNN